ncbi:MAG: hypothetical protein HOP29_11915 [Phycisphaerales bacterium]|nr:hypothetical protein [Phycisphaerales bacterium]
MTYRGRVRNGVIVLDQPGILPEGAEVEVLRKAVHSPEESSENGSGPTWAEVFADITGKAEGLPPDLSRNHDHYVHGAPRQ